MASSSSLPPPSPSPLAQISEFAQDSASIDSRPEHPSLASIPELTTKPAVSEDDKVEALHLLADSVAQQRQLASSAVIFHPFTLSMTALLFGLVYQKLYKGSPSDYAIIGTTFTGAFMAVLVTIRWLTSGYIDEAGNVGTWKWLNKGRGERDSGAVGDEDEILLTWFGDEVIGTLILRGQRATPPSSSGSSSPKKSRKNHPVVGIIRGWTVKRRYRHKGVGQGLLEEAVQLCQSQGWNGPEFADDHANSRQVLPRTFHGGFAKRERIAREMLERVRDEVGKPISISGGSRKGKR
ncbi:hypothetical protein A1O3_04830 [Capronia epimyces CBS 606.96]|uniref:N-acetyltransferase domain-containing protein n=1 Tax=Capronia epimyces CBS 606.96 TaxID=1182542 RepID=W9XVA0_9EURO|nr:uncharacterized protein A1O3_04830 [Capronia epimyces CBS 606.96]EXJ84163.1 hypothetical protein A1O3_04830 [Capronia epimyces CBS 606.96]